MFEYFIIFNERISNTAALNLPPHVCGPLLVCAFVCLMSCSSMDWVRTWLNVLQPAVLCALSLLRLRCCRSDGTVDRIRKCASSRDYVQKWVPGVFPGGKGGRWVRLTTLPPSCADCHETWEPHPPGALRVCTNL